MNAINPAEQAAAEAKRYHIEFPILICRETGILSDYQVTKLPHLFIIDQEGTIISSKLFLKTTNIKEVLDSILDEVPEAAENEE
jgi:hypothetical protein